MRPVSIVGVGLTPVRKKSDQSLREMAASAVRLALADAGDPPVQALYVANMLSDELQGQKNLGPLVADEAGLAGVEAWQARAATAGGAAAFRLAFLAVASGQTEAAVAVGVEKMSDGVATPVLAKALDAQKELPEGATLLSQNARLMQAYLSRYRLPGDALAHFAVNAHQNGLDVAHALFDQRPVGVAEVMASRLISPPIRLYDCSPICDGAAAVVLMAGETAVHHPWSVRILASGAATDRFRLADRPEPLRLVAAERSAAIAYRQAGIGPAEVDLFELHDAFSIVAALSLEAAGFAAPGEGWRLAADGEVGRNGRYPIATFGGLKARGHPIGATALYQAGELAWQLSGRAGANQVTGARLGLMQSVGGAGSLVISHILAAREGATPDW